MLAVWLAVTVSAAPASLREAHQLYDELKYAEALKALAKARLTPDLSTADLLDALWLQGLCAVSMGNVDDARLPWRTLAWLDPTFQPQGELPPKLLTPWYEARGWAASQKPPGFDGRLRDDGAVELTLQADPLKLAAGVRLHLKKGDAAPETVALGAPPQSHALDGVTGWWAELVGGHGEVLATLGSAESPRPGPPPKVVKVEPPPPPRPAPHRPRLVPLLLGAGGVVGLAMGAGFGVASNDARASFDGAARLSDGTISGITQRDAASLESEHQRDAVIANVCFGVAAALATTALLYFFLGPQELF